jgi:hypothetical protein
MLLGLALACGSLEDYQWPTQMMMDPIVGSGCLLLGTVYIRAVTFGSSSICCEVVARTVAQMFLKPRVEMFHFPTENVKSWVKLDWSFTNSQSNEPLLFRSLASVRHLSESTINKVKAKHCFTVLPRPQTFCLD